MKATIPTLDEQSEAQLLISRYARSLDASDVPSVLECFTADVSLSYEDGRVLITGRADTEAFLRGALGTPATHLLGNFAFDRVAGAMVVTCSAIACVCRKADVVTLRGLVYVFTCVNSGSGLRIRKLRHSLKWQFEPPGGPPSL
jgi:SnoaL-like domain